MSLTDEQVIAAALKARKITAAEAPRYRERLADPQQRAGYQNLLTAKVAAGGLAPGTVTAEEAEPYPAGWVPEVQAKAPRASAPAGGSRVQIEDPDGPHREPGHRRVTRGD